VCPFLKRNVSAASLPQALKHDGITSKKLEESEREWGWRGSQWPEHIGAWTVERYWI
jgi:hypothetical protein